MRETPEREHSDALAENMIRSGGVQHAVACDLLFAEFQVYSQDRCDERHEWNEPRGCDCEKAALRAAGRIP